MSDRVVTFLDYQNLYRGARRAFHAEDAPHACGQIDPVWLGELIVARSPYDRVLHQVRIYRGLPDATRDPKGNAAAVRQISLWERDPRVHVITRPLRYPKGWPDRSLPGDKPQEKGIDVALALDFLAMAIHSEYDVGVMLSTDTDLKPALEHVVELARSSGMPRVEVAGWTSGAHTRRLAIEARKLWCHWLDKTIYAQVADMMNYANGL